MPYAAPKKGTILIPSGPTHDPGRKHLFVICTDPCAEGRQAIISISTMTNLLCDQTCILQAHEHAFLTTASFVFYRKARVELQRSLVLGVERGLFAPQEPMNGQSFLRVVRGLCQSPQTPPAVKVYLGCPAL